jgi:hypothetical protein
MQAPKLGVEVEAEFAEKLLPLGRSLIGRLTNILVLLFVLIILISILSQFNSKRMQTRKLSPRQHVVLLTHCQGSFSP